MTVGYKSRICYSLCRFIYIYIFSQKRYFWTDGYYYGETRFIKFVNIQIYFSIIRKRNKSVNSIEANNEKSKSIVVTRSLFPDRTLLYRGILVDARLNEFPNWLNPLSIRKLVLFEREIVGKRGKINGITIIFVSYNRLENITKYLVIILSNRIYSLSLPGTLLYLCGKRGASMVLLV